MLYSCTDEFTPGEKHRYSLQDDPWLRFSQARIALDADGVLRAGFKAEQAALAGFIVDLERLQIDHIGQGAGFHTLAAMGALGRFNLGAIADQTGAIEGGAE